MVVFVGISWGVLGVLILFSLVGGAFALEKVVAFLLGPMKWIAIVVCILSAIGYIGFSLYSEEYKQRRIGSRVISCLCNSVGSVLRNGINAIMIICILAGFLQRMDRGGLVHTLFGLLAFLGDGLICLLLLCGSGVIDYFAINTQEMATIPPVLISICHLMISLFYLFLVQGIVFTYYKSTAELLFLNHPQIGELIVKPWILVLIGIV